MVFNSAQFLLFLPLAALGYFAVPQKARRPWLLLACYFFYFCWNPAHVPVQISLSMKALENQAPAEETEE